MSQFLNIHLSSESVRSKPFDWSSTFQMQEEDIYEPEPELETEPEAMDSEPMLSGRKSCSHTGQVFPDQKEKTQQYFMPNPSLFHRPSDLSFLPGKILTPAEDEMDSLSGASVSESHDSTSSFWAHDWKQESLAPSVFLDRIKAIESYLMVIRGRVNVNKVEAKQAQEAANMIRKQLALNEQEQKILQGSTEQKINHQLTVCRQAVKQDWEDSSRKVLQQLQSLQADVQALSSLTNGIKKGLLFHVEKHSKENEEVKKRLTWMEQKSFAEKSNPEKGSLIKKLFTVIFILWMIFLTYTAMNPPVRYQSSDFMYT